MMDIVFAIICLGFLIVAVFLFIKAHNRYIEADKKIELANNYLNEHSKLYAEYKVMKEQFAEHLETTYSALCSKCQPLFHCENVNMGKVNND